MVSGKGREFPRSLRAHPLPKAPCAHNPGCSLNPSPWAFMEAPQSFLALEPRMSALAEWHFLFRKLGPNSMEVYLPDSLDLMC